VTRTTRVPATTCPKCGTVSDAASDYFANNRPVPGDVTVCIYCGATCVFDDSLLLRRATRADIATLDATTAHRLGRIAGAVAKLKREREH
jgi:hypothetical protein